jgi:hypothetical protein
MPIEAEIHRPEMQEAIRTKCVAKSAEEILAHPELCGTERSRVPFFAVHVVDRNERRLSAHREPHVAASEFIIDEVPDRAD